MNGAGKTSTFRMLTAEATVSSGDAFLAGYSVKSDWRKAGQHIGYCPQFDAVLKVCQLSLRNANICFQELSGEETLRMFARIRGIPKNEIDRASICLCYFVSYFCYFFSRSWKELLTRSEFNNTLRDKSNHTLVETRGDSHWEWRLSVSVEILNSIAWSDTVTFLRYRIAGRPSPRWTDYWCRSQG